MTSEVEERPRVNGLSTIPVCWLWNWQLGHNVTGTAKKRNDKKTSKLPVFSVNINAGVLLVSLDAMLVNHETDNQPALACEVVLTSCWMDGGNMRTILCEISALKLLKNANFSGLLSSQCIAKCLAQEPNKMTLVQIYWLYISTLHIP